MSDPILNFHGLSRVLAEQDFQTVRESWLNSLSRLGSFPFRALPSEIAVAILKLAVTKSSTYSVLMRTSRAIATLARLECIPEMVILANSAVAISFYACISVHPQVGARVKQLWFLPGLAPKQAASVCPAILKACSNVDRLACVPEALIEICSGTGFRHTSLVDVMLMDPIIPWETLLGSRHGTTLFKQIQTLRLVGGTQPTIPPLGTSFRNLTDLTLSSTTTNFAHNYMLRFPDLMRVVITVPYMAWRATGMSYLMSEPEMADARLCVVHCSKKWKEIGVWKEGNFTIWNLGATEWNARANPGSTMRVRK
ncbi:hypothetical protein B0H19DRAFT_308662 [Mycena capillaripes]|nr:hypothetical protein B0H19DRAFT_308662 [Mycena capillaripes]